MNNSSDLEQQNINSENDNNQHQTKIQQVIQGFEMFSLQKNQNSLEFTNLTDKQKDKLIDIIALNESNAYKFKAKKIESDEKIKEKLIDSQTINQKTIKQVILFGMFIFVAVTILILFYKDNYFSQWLSFIAGLLGGFGLRSASKFLIKEPQISTPKKEEQPEEIE
jgi:hypothetical protein